MLALGSEHLEAWHFWLGLAGGEDGDHGDPVEVEVGLDAQHGTDGGSRRREVGGEDAPGFLRTSGAPRPRAVRAGARQLHIDPPGHRP